MVGRLDSLILEVFSNLNYSVTMAGSTDRPKQGKMVNQVWGSPAVSAGGQTGDGAGLSVGKRTMQCTESEITLSAAQVWGFLGS